MYGNPYVSILIYSSNNSILEDKGKMRMVRIIEEIIDLKRGIGMIGEMIEGIGRIEGIEGISGEMTEGMTDGDRIEEMITDKTGGGMIDGETKDMIEEMTEKIVIVENIVANGVRGEEVTITGIMDTGVQVATVKDANLYDYLKFDKNKPSCYSCK